MKFEEGAEVIWQDRKRHCGLPWSFYRYYLVKKEGQWVKLFRHKGFLSAIIDEINVYRCFDITLQQTLVDKIFRTGTIEIASNDERAPKFHLRHITNPYQVRDLLSNTIEQERTKRHVGITEIQNL